MELTTPEGTTEAPGARARRAMPGVLVLLLIAAVGNSALGSGETEPTLAVQGDQSGIDATLTVISYNVHAVAVPDPKNFFATRKGRLRQIAPLLDAYDVVMLQEFFGVKGLRRDRFQRNLLDRTAHKDHLDQGPIGPDYDTGLAILSSRDLHSVKFHNYGHCVGELVFRGSDCRARKGFLAARLRFGGEEIHLYSTHLDAYKDDRSRQARIYQLDTLQAYIERHSAKRAIILAGDFNIRRVSDAAEDDGERFARFIDELGLSDACGENCCDRSTCPDWKLCGLDELDYVLYRSADHKGPKIVFEEGNWLNPRGKEGRGKRLSDHPALAVRFAVTTKD